MNSPQTSNSIQEIQPQERTPDHPNPDQQPSSQDDFLEQMISSLPSWAEISESPFTNSLSNTNNGLKLFSMPLISKNGEDSPENLHYTGSYYDMDSTMLASRLRQHQISGSGEGRNSPGVRPPLGVLQLNTADLGVGHSEFLNTRALRRSASANCVDDVSGESMPHLPLSLGQGGCHLGSSSPDSHLVDKPRDDVQTSFDNGSNMQPIYHGFQAVAAETAADNQRFQKNYAGESPEMNPNLVSGGTVPSRPRVRARRGQATDPHSIAERLRRERIAERMRALQDLVPNANKTDKASMLDEIIDYVKFLQFQVKVLSMSRLGGAGAAAPLVADLSSAEKSVGMLRRSISLNSNPTAAELTTGDNAVLAENDVVKLMEEDMGSAMQYLQGKGLCLMPISLASAISTATCNSKSSNNRTNNNVALASNSSSSANNGGDAAKDATMLNIADP